MPSWVYILRCADRSYYTGCTTDLDQRLGEHQAGETPGYTSTRLPVDLVYAAEFQTIHDAIAAERRIKGWSRAKKEAMIGGRWEDLPALSKTGLRPARR
jgi:putative endonuclease